MFNHLIGEYLMKLKNIQDAGSENSRSLNYKSAILNNFYIGNTFLLMKVSDHRPPCFPASRLVLGT